MNKHVIEKWQGLLQQIVLLVGRGYYFYEIISLPEKKKDKWEIIDNKLLLKFGADLSRFQRARRKKKGLANLVYLRWEHLVVVLKTDGQLDISIEDEPFQDVRRKPMQIKVGSEVIFQIIYDNKTNVRLSSETYRGLKDVLWNLAQTGNVGLVKQELQKLNGLPGYAGVNEQKNALAHFARKQLGKHGVKTDSRAFPLRMKRKIVKVFQDDNETKEMSGELLT